MENIETKFKFIDHIKRGNIEQTINRMLEEEWIFVAFLQNDGSYDETIGILFKRRGFE